MKKKTLIPKNKKIYLYGGVAVAVIGVVGYFIFSESDQEKAENKSGTPAPETKLSNGVNVNTDPNSAHGKELEAWVKNKKNERIQLVKKLLAAFNKEKNNPQAVQLLTDNIKDDEYMKVFKRTFHYHNFTKKGFLWQEDKTYRWDLKSWIDNRLSHDQNTTLKSRYPSLETNLE